LFILHAYQPIRFEQITRAGNGPTQLRVAGPPGVPGHVQRSADLRNWNDWLPVNFAEASIAVIDSDASSPAFYRLVMP